MYISNIGKVLHTQSWFWSCISTILTPDILNPLNFARYWKLDNLKGLFSFRTLYVIIQPNLYFFEVDKCKNWYMLFWQTAEPQLIKSVPKSFLRTGFIWVTVSSLSKMDKNLEIKKTVNTLESKYQTIEDLPSIEVCNLWIVLLPQHFNFVHSHEKECSKYVFVSFQKVQHNAYFFNSSK